MREEPSTGIGRAPAKSPAERLAIPTYALTALEHQARRHYRRWRLEEAERLAKMALRFDVGRSAPWLVLGDIEMRRMHWRAAFKHFQQAVDCNRADSLAWCRGGEALFRLEAFEHARQWLEEAVSLGSACESLGASRACQILEHHREVFARARRAAALGAANVAGDDGPTQPLPAAGPREDGKNVDQKICSFRRDIRR